MTVSVLTIVQNRAGHLEQLVEGLRRSFVTPHELIVVDMGSDPPVRVEGVTFPCRIVHMPIGGLPLAAARNTAANLATGQKLLFLDVDCIAMRGLVGAMTEALEAENALICAQVRYLGKDDARGEWEEADLLERSTGHSARRFPAAGMRREDNAGLFWSLVFGIRRDQYNSLGGFDEAFTGYGAEDTDFGFRAREAKVPLLFMGGPGAFHQHHDILDPPLQHIEDIVRNACIFYEKWGRWPMEGWLGAFERLGFVAWKNKSLTLLRLPTESEITAAIVM